MASKTEAKYSPSGSPQEHCALCTHFSPPSHCTVVTGAVTANGWCRFFNKRAVAKKPARKSKG